MKKYLAFVLVLPFVCFLYLYGRQPSPRAVTKKAKWRRDGDVVLPDPEVTPGEARTTDASEICSQTFTTRDERHTTQAMKREVCLEYGVDSGCPGKGWEIDHLISLELGGADTIKNLFPQPENPRPGFHEKDRLENALHKMVCGKKIPLAQAQQEISSDWWKAYQKYVQPQTSGRENAKNSGRSPRAP